MPFAPPCLLLAEAGRGFGPFELLRRTATRESSSWAEFCLSADLSQLQAIVDDLGSERSLLPKLGQQRPQARQAVTYRHRNVSRILRAPIGFASTMRLCSHEHCR
jgi:hypothetical protein